MRISIYVIFSLEKKNYLIGCTVSLASRIYQSHDQLFFLYLEKCKILKEIQCISIYVIFSLEKNYLIWCTVSLASRIYESHDLPFFLYWEAKYWKKNTVHLNWCKEIYMVCTFVTSCCYLLSNMEYVSPCQSWAVNIGARLHDMSEYVRVGLIKRLIPMDGQGYGQGYTPDDP